MMPTLIFSIWLMSNLMMLTNHPLSMGMILLIQTLSISLTSGLMNLNFWYSYILFIVMIGGMLVLFIYMTSIASNEKFKFSSKILLMITVTAMILLLTMFLDQMPINFSTNNYDHYPISKTTINEMSLMKYFNYPNNLILLMMINYLLITLIMVAKITKIEYGPLRQKY